MLRFRENLSFSKAHVFPGLWTSKNPQNKDEKSIEPFLLLLPRKHENQTGRLQILPAHVIQSFLLDSIYLLRGNDPFLEVSYSKLAQPSVPCTPIDLTKPTDTKKGTHEREC